MHSEKQEEFFLTDSFLKSMVKANPTYLFLLIAYFIGCSLSSAAECYKNVHQSEKDTVPITEKISIRKKYINYDEKRKELSLEYLKLRHGIIKSAPVITPKMIILHNTGGGTLESNFNYFNHTEIETARDINRKQSKLNVSAHYLIDRDGAIYQLMDDTAFARHSIGLNYCAIGIENIGNEKAPLTKEQVKANAELIRYLCSKYSIEYMIGHSEYIQFRNTPLWKELDPDYITFKLDPGDEFLKQVRLLIKDLHLKYKP